MPSAILMYSPSPQGDADSLRAGEETEERERRRSCGGREGGGEDIGGVETGVRAKFAAVLRKTDGTPFTEVKSERSKRATSLEAGERDGALLLESVSDMVCAACVARGGEGWRPPATLLRSAIPYGGGSVPRLLRPLAQNYMLHPHPHGQKHIGIWNMPRRPRRGR